MLPCSYDQGLADEPPRARIMMNKNEIERGLESHANKSNQFRSGLGNFVKALRSETHEGQIDPARSFRWERTARIEATTRRSSFFRSLPFSKRFERFDACVDPGPACCCYVRPAISRVRATLANRSIDTVGREWGMGTVACGWGAVEGEGSEGGGAWALSI
jgi:hypothetical protein